MRKFIVYAYRFFLLLFFILAIGVGTVYYRELRESQGKEASDETVRVADLLEEGGQVVDPKDLVPQKPENEKIEDDVPVEDISKDFSDYLTRSDVLIKSKVPALNRDYFIDLSGENIINVNAHHLGGFAESSFLKSDRNDFVDGQLTFTQTPGGPTVDRAPLYINPETSGNDYAMFGVALDGDELFKISSLGDTHISRDLHVSGVMNSTTGHITGNLTVDGTITGDIVGTISPGLTEGSVAFIDSSGNFTEDNSNFFWDDTNNRLGIGTASPLATLDIFGQSNLLRFDNNSNPIVLSTSGTGGNQALNIDQNLYVSKDLRLIGGSSSRIETIGTNQDLHFAPNGTGDSVFANGNVGIGTTDPAFVAHINNTATDFGTGLLISSSASGANDGAGIEFGYGGGSSTGSRIARIMPSTEVGGGGDLLFQTAPSATGSYDTKLTILRNGNVGIGTTDPLASLHVSGGTGAVIGGNFADYSSITENSLVVDAQSNGVFLAAHDGSSRIKMEFNADNYEWEAGGSGAGMVLDSSGNVGIGTDSPVNKLSVVSGDDKDSGPILRLAGSAINQTESGRIRFTEDSSNYQGGYIAYDGQANLLNIGIHLSGDQLASSDVPSISISRNTGDVVFNESGLSSDFRIEGDTDANLFFTDASTDRVGIGKNDPAYDLDVSGDIRIDGGNALRLRDNNTQYITLTHGGTAGALYNYVGDFQIFNIADADIIFRTNNSTRFRIENNGLVGIGAHIIKHLFDIDGSYGGNALVSLNETGSNDIFTASASGTTKYIIGNDGETTFRASSFDSTNANGLYVPWVSGDTGNAAIYAGASTSGNDKIGVWGNSYSGTGVRGNSNSSYGLIGGSNSGVGVLGTSTSSNGGYFLSSGSGIGVLGQSATGIGVDALLLTGSENSTDDVIQLRKRVSGTPLDGLGAQIRYELETDTTVDVFAGGISVDWTDVSHSTRLSEMTFNTTDSGTTIPALSLSSNGAIFNENGLATADFRVEGDTDANLFFVDAGLEAIGIGTTPAASTHRVTIASSGANTNLVRLLSSDSGVLFNLTEANDTGSYFEMRDASNLAAIVLNSNGESVLNQQGDPDNDFRIEGDTDANLFFTDASADAVGIGTTNPSIGKLQVSGNVYSAGTLQVVNTTNDGLTNRGFVIAPADYNGQSTFTAWNNSGGSTVFGSRNTGNGNLTAQLAFSAGNAAQTFIALSAGETTPIERLRIDSSGNVGIGTDSPVHKFDLEGFYGGNALMALNETGGNDIFTASASGTTRFTIKNDGYVGIGTNAPQSKLHVSGGDVKIDTSYDLAWGSAAWKIGQNNDITNGLEFYTRGAAGDENFTFRLSNSMTESSGIKDVFNIDFTANQSGTAGYTALAIDVTETALGSGDSSLIDAAVGGSSRFRVQNSGLTDASVDGIATLVNAGAITDGSYAGNAVDGLLGVDSSNGRLYFRYGGAWHYTAQTAGFQIPDYEAFAYDFNSNGFKTDVALKEGDFLLPFVESTLEDGAKHGLYARFSDVKQNLFADAYTQIDELDSRLRGNDGTYKDLATLAYVDNGFKDIYKQIEGEFIKRSELDKHISFIDNIINVFSEVVFNAKATYKSSVEFIADATFRGSVHVNADTAGEIVIPANTRKFRINFDNEFSVAPIVYLNATNTDSEVSVIDVTTTYFEAEIDPSVNYDIKIKWLALIADKNDPEKLHILESSETIDNTESVEEVLQMSTQSAEILETTSSAILVQ